jgi:hypothetical protein
MTRRHLVVTLVFVLAAAGGVFAQRFGRGYRAPEGAVVTPPPNAPYDGRFAFVRLRYPTRWDGFRHLGDGGLPWSHDWPTSDIHFMKIMDEVTYLRPRTDTTDIIALDDPELFNYPLAYLCEPGYWSLTEKEASNLRAYLKKGGFIMFDDFRGYDWNNLQSQMALVVPEWHWVRVDSGSEPIWHSFFEIKDPLSLPSYGYQQPSYWGIYEDNDPKKRLVAVAAVNGDLSEFWEWSDTGYAPVDISNEAYKFGVNFVIYGITH